MDNFILQCKSCNTIFSESTNMIDTALDLDFDSFTVATNVCKSSKRELSSSNFDMGAFFHDMKCGSCDATVGRLYEEVPLALVEIRLAFNFFHDKTRRHRRNRGTISQIDLVPISSGDGQPKRKDGSTSMAISMTENRIEGNSPPSGWRDELFKLQSVVLSLNERLSALERGHHRERVVGQRLHKIMCDSCVNS